MRSRLEPADRLQKPQQAVLAALADATRHLVLRSVAARGSATATELAADLPVSRQAVVKHLNVLDRAGLVARTQRGREVRYAVDPTPLRDVARHLEQIAANWDRRMSALKAMAEGAAARKAGRR